jgi:hypothetical protein
VILFIALLLGAIYNPRITQVKNKCKESVEQTAFLVYNKTRKELTLAELLRVIIINTRKCNGRSDIH